MIQSPGPPDLTSNAERFSGFADLYDSVRPQPPDVLARILTSYCGGRPRLLVDVGSGTGLSSRWASGWVDHVIGVEPSDDMRRVAETQAVGNVSFTAGWSHDTTLSDAGADIVMAVQALHWMEPTRTFAEAARLLRTGGVFVALDCDWPPTTGVAEADKAWAKCHRRIQEVEARLTVDGEGPAITAPRRWSKGGHLARMNESGYFSWVHEFAVHREEEANSDRFVDLLKSQGDYQTLHRAGVDDESLGVWTFEQTCRDALGPEPRTLWFTFRVRVGIV